MYSFYSLTKVFFSKGEAQLAGLGGNLRPILLKKELLASLYTKCYEKFRMLLFSAEKQLSIFFEFFNRIGQERTLSRHKKTSAMLA
jgi:hypothetical protein